MEMKLIKQNKNHLTQTSGDFPLDILSDCSSEALCICDKISRGNGNEID